MFEMNDAVAENLHGRIAAPTPALSYELGTLGTLDCPNGYSRIYDQTICNAAATALGLTFTVTTYSDYLKGCSYEGNAKTIFYNNHLTGGDLKSWVLSYNQVVCSGDGTGATTCCLKKGFGWLALAHWRVLERSHLA